MIKTLAKSIREYKKPSLLAPFFVSLEVVLEVLIPYMMANIIDIGITQGNMPYILKVGIMLVFMAMLSLLFGALSGKFAARAAAGFAKNLRKDMFYNIQGFSFSNIDHFSTASLVTRLTTDVTNVQNAYQMIVRILIRAPVMLVFALIMAMQINMELSLIFLAAIPLLGVGLYLIATRAHPHFREVFNRYDILNRTVQEDLTGVRVVKAYVREDHEIENSTIFRRMYTNALKPQKKLWRSTAAYAVYHVYLHFAYFLAFGAYHWWAAACKPAS